jgi:hypothetical protein
MPAPDPNSGIVDLPEAIKALRDALAAAWWDGQGHRVRFRLDPVELTLQAGVTRTGTGSAGIRWHLLSLGGERTRESEAVQILKLRLITDSSPAGTGRPEADEHEPE